MLWCCAIRIGTEASTFKNVSCFVFLINCSFLYHLSHHFLLLYVFVSLFWSLCLYSLFKEFIALTTVCNFSLKLQWKNWCTFSSGKNKWKVFYIRYTHYISYAELEQRALGLRISATDRRLRYWVLR